MPGDVVVSIGDDPIADSSDLVEALAASKPGQRVQMVVRRGDRRLSLDVTLGGR
jgi:serine protease DegQ